MHRVAVQALFDRLSPKSCQPPFVVVLSLTVWQSHDYNHLSLWKNSRTISEAVGIRLVATRTRQSIWLLSRAQVETRTSPVKKYQSFSSPKHLLQEFAQMLAIVLRLEWVLESRANGGAKTIRRHQSTLWRNENKAQKENRDSRPFRPRQVQLLSQLLPRVNFALNLMPFDLGKGYRCCQSMP
jgi:hypothetical protein